MTQINKLGTTAQSLFGALSAAELKLLNAVTTGNTAFGGPTDRDADPANNPGEADGWGADREVRAELIRWLCSDRDALGQLDARGITLHGAKVTGVLDLSFLNIPFPIRLFNCRLLHSLIFRYASIPMLNLSRSWVTSVIGDIAEIKGTVFLKQGFRASGQVLFRGTRIGGNLNCNGGIIEASEVAQEEDHVVALSVEGAKIAGSILLRERFQAHRQIRLFLAEIGGNVICENATITSPAVGGDKDSGIAVHGEAAKIGGSVLLRFGLRTSGGIRFFRAEVGGHFECDQSFFSNPAVKDVAQSGWVLNVEGAKISGSLYLRDRFIAEGLVRLRGCDVGGNLICDGGQFRNPLDPDHSETGTALDAEAIRVAGFVSMRQKAAFEGRVRLFGADIGLALICDTATFKNPAVSGKPESGVALDVGVAKIGGDIVLREAVVEGQCTLFGAHIDGNLECQKATFVNPNRKELRNTGTALNARAIKVAGNVSLQNSSVDGDVRMFGADLGRILDFTDCRLKSLPSLETPLALALDLATARVGGSLLLRGKGFKAEGLIRFGGAVIGGEVDCENGKFTNPAQAGLAQSGVTMDGFASRISGSVLLRNGFESYGQVQLSGATIARSLECDRGRFEATFVKDVPSSAVALRAEAIAVAGEVLLRKGFLAIGEVRLFGARIEHNLDCRAGTFRAHKHTDSGAALVASRAKIKGDLLLSEGFVAEGPVLLDGVEIDGVLRTGKGQFRTLDLSDASAGLIADHADSWPDAGNLKLDGFAYNRISKGPHDADERVNWVERQKTFARQPYRQLARVLEDTGDDVGAKRVLSAMQRKAWEGRGTWGRILGFILRVTIGYGYFPLRALRLLILLVLAGGIVYTLGYNFGSIVPNDKDAFSNFEKTCTVPPQYERFSPITYSLENTLPLVKLGIQDKWTPAPERRATCWPARAIAWVPPAATHPGAIRIFRWFQICIGWLLGTLFVGGVTGVLRKG